MIYFFLCLLSFVLTYVIRKIAIKKAMFDIPNNRSSHNVPTPHGGGVAITITWFIGLLYLYIFSRIDEGLFFALSAGLIIAIVSLLDDIFHIKPSIRLIIQGLVACLGLILLGGIEFIDLEFFIITNKIINNIFAFFMIIWFVNLYNFLDGIDGYAGSEAIFLGLAGFVLFGNDIFLILVTSVVGFLVLNWHKAKIFMGDVGSTLLGYNIAIFAIYYQNNNYSLLLWFILFGLFFFDGTLTLFRRFRNQEKLHIAHKKHAYQRLHQSGLAHDKITILGVCVNIVLFGCAYFALHVKGLLLPLFATAMMFLYLVVLLIDKRKDFA